MNITAAQQPKQCPLYHRLPIFLHISHSFDICEEVRKWERTLRSLGVV